MTKTRSLFEAIVVPSRMVFIMWLLFFIQFNYYWNINSFGVHPRSVEGLIGIFTMPLLHGGVLHIVSNTLPLLVLGTMLYMFYPNIANRVFYQCYFFTNILVWIFGRQANHIGASGLIYGLFAFLILLGIFRRDFRSVLISLAVIAVYGSLYFRMIPDDPWVSWESHLLGAVVGATNAYVLRTRY